MRSSRRNASNTGTTLLACALAAAAGAALMYFLEPAWRRSRRPEGAEPLDDTVLVERVRAALGRTIADPQAIDVKAFDGRVVLRGPVTPEELAEIVACTSRVRGVREVDNRLSPNTGLAPGGTA